MSGFEKLKAATKTEIKNFDSLTTVVLKPLYGQRNDMGFPEEREQPRLEKYTAQVHDKDIDGDGEIDELICFDIRREKKNPDEPTKPSKTQTNQLVCAGGL